MVSSPTIYSFYLHDESCQESTELAIPKKSGIGLGLLGKRNVCIKLALPNFKLHDSFDVVLRLSAKYGEAKWQLAKKTIAKHNIIDKGGENFNR